MLGVFSRGSSGSVSVDGGADDLGIVVDVGTVSLWARGGPGGVAQGFRWLALAVKGLCNFFFLWLFPSALIAIFVPNPLFFVFLFELSYFPSPIDYPPLILWWCWYFKGEGEMR